MDMCALVCMRAGLQAVFPPVSMCTDNGVMAAFAGLLSYELGVGEEGDIDISPRWPMGQPRPLWLNKRRRREVVADCGPKI